MPKKVKKLTAATGKDVKTVVDDYLEHKNLSRHISFNYAGLQRLKGPVKIEIHLKWTESVGGTVKIDAKGSDGTTIETQETTVLIDDETNVDEVQDLLTEAGLWT